MKLFPFPIAPEQASQFARQSDWLFLAITLLTVFFTVGVLAVLTFFAIKYRAGSKANRSKPQHENLMIEIAWSLPPLLLGLVIFAWGSWLFIGQRRPPKNAIDIYVVGKQWMWHIEHPNGVREMNELHVPSGVPVKLTMISQDVIHAFYIPQFRLQYMVVPGRYTYEWFIPTKPGRYYLFCAMHCGTGHSEMGGYVYVMPPKDYATWLANGGSMPGPNTETMAQKGQRLYTQFGCGNCHTNQDNEHAPSLYGIYNKNIALVNGTTRIADDEYIRASISNPYASMVQGYSNTMPTYTVGGAKGDLSEEDMDNMIAYIKSLSTTKAPSSGEPQKAAPSPTTGTAAPSATGPAGTSTPKAGAQTTSVNYVEKAR